MTYTSTIFHTPRSLAACWQTLIPFATKLEHPDIHIAQLLPDKASIGIDQIHNLLTPLSYRPVMAPYTVVIIFPADLLTLPAQQALLKTLEEPPLDTQIFLITNRPGVLLPTVLSRCTVQKDTQVSSEESSNQGWLPRIEKASAGECITLAEEAGKTKQEARQTLTALLSEFPKLPATHRTFESQRHVLTAIKSIDQNINVKLVLEHCFFQLRTTN